MKTEDIISILKMLSSEVYQLSYGSIGNEYKKEAYPMLELLGTHLVRLRIDLEDTYRQYSVKELT